MPHPNDIEIKLGFDQIRQRLESHCLSSLGVDLVAQMHFLTEDKQLKLLLSQCDEFLKIIEQGDQFPETNYFNPNDSFVKSALEGSYLDEPELLKIAYSIQTIIGCVTYLKKNSELYPELFKLSESVHLSDKLWKQIVSAIDENGFIKDTASKELALLRKRLREEQARARKSIDQVYKYAIAQKWIPEGALPTIRGGRLVIPILAEHKRKVKGFIQDESATGQTVFMEPAETLEANNEIRDLEHAEKREVIKILKALTHEVRTERPALIPAYGFLARMDFTRAKAKLARSLDARLPKVQDRPALNWINARHPLLHFSLSGNRELIPLHISLTQTDRILLVSGPNAGGKSVCLKTVGLLQYMIQCGLLIPVSPDSTVGIFDDLFIDIGDQQSIENDLSTYSSHLRNMAHFIKHATSNSMVLLDELGSGTDPNFGGAIAQALLSSLVGKRVWGVATTHYYNLKLFASEYAGIRNAAMRFDEKKMIPLYTLEIDRPGSSYALEIASKTGLPQNILDEAEQIVGADLVGLEKLSRTLEKERVDLMLKLQQAANHELKLRESLKQYENLKNDLESKKKDIIKKAKEEAQQLLTKANREIEKTIRHIRENQAQKKETSKMRKNLVEISKQVADKTVWKKSPELIQPGDRVRIIGQEGSGVVISVTTKSALVQFGELNSKVELSKLERADHAKGSSSVSSRAASGLKLHEKRAHYKSTLDVRGKRAEEVIPLMDQFLDTSLLLGETEIRILHGKGDGILRKVVREQLRKFKHVASVADEHIDRGGDGITVVILK